MAQASSLFEDVPRSADVLDAVGGVIPPETPSAMASRWGIASGIVARQTLYLQYLEALETERGRGIGRSLTAVRPRAAPQLRRAVLDPVPDVIPRSPDGSGSSSRSRRCVHRVYYPPLKP